MIKNDINSGFKGLIYIVGFMASGKTLTGRLLSNSLNIPFVDLDSEIQIGEGKSIKDIFEFYGEDHFRLLENAYLRKSTNLTTAIISTGGGTPFYYDNMSFMNSMGTSLYLEVPYDVIWKRLENNKINRPLASNMDINMLNSLYMIRVNTYEKALKVFKYNEEHSIADQVKHILKMLN